MFQKVLDVYGLDSKEFTVEPFGSGLINHTWKVSNAEKAYVLQRININVFKSPGDIAHNLLLLKRHLDLTAPKYLFVAPIDTVNGDQLVELEGDFYRLFPFVKGSHSLDSVTKSEEAYHAAKQFGKFTRMLDAFDVKKLKPTISDFHNLPLRVEQFKQALKTAADDRLKRAAWAIEETVRHLDIAVDYQRITEEGNLTNRVIHHDTKISNVLLSEGTGVGLCVIDLDTVMPGYFISDVGDMMRTYLSEANEEETNLDRVQVRVEIFSAIYKGYMEEMHRILSVAEDKLFVYSGKFMIYMQALRFLTDFLNGDVYYKTTYPEQNLKRALNQIDLLNKYIAAEPEFNEAIKAIDLKKGIEIKTV